MQGRDNTDSPVGNQEFCDVKLGMLRNKRIFTSASWFRCNYKITKFYVLLEVAFTFSSLKIESLSFPFSGVFSDLTPFKIFENFTPLGEINN
jgi:hypothetical protein